MTGLPELPRGYWWKLKPHGNDSIRVGLRKRWNCWPFWTELNSTFSSSSYGKTLEEELAEDVMRLYAAHITANKRDEVKKLIKAVKKGTPLEVIK